MRAKLPTVHSRHVASHQQTCFGYLLHESKSQRTLFYQQHTSASFEQIKDIVLFKLQKQRIKEKSSLIFFLRRNPTKNSDFKIEIVNTTKPKHDARPSVWKLEGTRTPLLRYIVSIIRWSTQQLIRCECDRQKHGAWTMELASGARDVEVEWSKHGRLALPCLPACLPIAHPKSTRRTRAARTSPLASDSHIMAHSGAHACLACAISSARDMIDRYLPLWLCMILRLGRTANHRST
jgi:hypothetical protein